MYSCMYIVSSIFQRGIWYFLWGFDQFFDREVSRYFIILLRGPCLQCNFYISFLVFQVLNQRFWSSSICAGFTSTSIYCQPSKRHSSGKTTVYRMFSTLKFFFKFMVYGLLHLLTWNWDSMVVLYCCLYSPVVCCSYFYNCGYECTSWTRQDKSMDTTCI